MCGVKLSEEEIFVIGGIESDNDIAKKEVWIYNPQNGFARNQGPSMNTGRYGHSCSTMIDGEKTVIVVAGGWGEDSVLIYDPADNAWHSGKTKSKPQKTFLFIIFKPK